MKKLYFIIVVLLFVFTIIGCDKDECPLCHECECICPKPNSETDTIVYQHIDKNIKSIDTIIQQLQI